MPEAVSRYFRDQYGFRPTLFADQAWYQREGREDLWLLDTAVDFDLPETVHTVGIRVFNRYPPAGYPSSTFLRRFHNEAKRGIIELPREQAARFAMGENIAWETDQLGYVIVRHAGLFLGRGFAREEGTLDSQVAKQFRLSSNEDLLGSSGA
jgi:hypothetical protein